MTFSLGGRPIGAGAATFFIAEAGVNHNGDLAMALRLVDVAADAGADAVKFQTFHAEALASRFAGKAAYQQETTGGGESQLAMLQKLELSMDAHRALVARCRERSIAFLSTPFDDRSADELEALGVAGFKIPSGEVTNLPFLARIAHKGRPMILSTGMSTLDEVAVAVECVRGAGAPPLALLHCVSAYPAPADETNLRAVDTLRERFGCVVGLSDHTMGTAVSVAAVARGAAIIEKHFTLDTSLPGPDHRCSLDPRALAQLVADIRIVETALGDGRKHPMPSERDTRLVARKSLVAAHPLRRGETLTADAVAVKRPGTGISPADLPRALGRRVRRDVAEDEVIGWDDME